MRMSMIIRFNAVFGICANRTALNDQTILDSVSRWSEAAQQEHQKQMTSDQSGGTRDQSWLVTNAYLVHAHQHEQAETVSQGQAQAETDQKQQIC